MEDQLEIQYRTEAKFCIRKVSNQVKLMAKVVYDELSPFMDFEKDMTGSHLRLTCEMIQDQVYVFSGPPGETLEEMFKQNIQFSPEQISSIFNQLLQGLYEIHQYKVLGRCFHPGNIYYYQKKIIFTGFGFYSNLKMLPPEYLQNKSYNKAIDMWLLGCILFQLCTGTLMKQFTTIQDYNSFYQTLGRKQIEPQFLDLLKQMLDPQEQRRLQFHQLYQMSLFQNVSEITKQFYLQIFRKFNMKKLIKIREAMDAEYLEWAVPKEFANPLRVPQGQIPFRKKVVPNSFLSQNVEVNRLEQPPRYQTEPLQTSIPEQPYPLLGQLVTIDEDPLPTIPEPTFLSFRNRAEGESIRFPDVWRELHFISYRFYLLQSLSTQLEGLDQPYIKWVRYFLSKMSIILWKEFFANMGSRRNFMSLPQSQWEDFLNNSSQYRRQAPDLQMRLTLDLSQLGTLMNEINQIPQDSLPPSEEKLYQQIRGSIKQEITENSFDELKLNYRRVLKHVYDDIQENLSNKEEEEPRPLALLQLKIIICMTINTIFTRDPDNSRTTNNRETAFMNLKNFCEIEELTSPYYIERNFFVNASLDDIISQTKQIHKAYFQQ